MASGSAGPVNRIPAAAREGAGRRGRSSSGPYPATVRVASGQRAFTRANASSVLSTRRSEEHTSELQSQSNLVCRLLLEKKKSILMGDEESLEIIGELCYHCL